MERLRQLYLQAWLVQLKAGLTAKIATAPESAYSSKAMVSNFRSVTSCVSLYQTACPFALVLLSLSPSSQASVVFTEDNRRVVETSTDTFNGITYVTHDPETPFSDFSFSGAGSEVHNSSLGETGFTAMGISYYFSSSSEDFGYDSVFDTSFTLPVAGEFSLGGFLGAGGGFSGKFGVSAVEIYQGTIPEPANLLFSALADLETPMTLVDFAQLLDPGDYRIRTLFAEEGASTFDPLNPDETSATYDLTGTFTAVPEPSSLAFGLLGLGAVGLRRR